jgi:hypothetical protein
MIIINEYGKWYDYDCISMIIAIIMIVVIIIDYMREQAKAAPVISG